ncbi:MAG TPA: DUF305 domain-containing protein [Rubricoccaceae bacterium]|nr:DUF305 domain-containing protein [Rubricoccaceae bacterium]
MNTWSRMTAVVCVLAAGCAAPRPPTAGPPARAGEPAGPVAAEADVRFMQGMIPHHAQALEMTALVADRTTNRALRFVAERIEVSQRDEIAWMTRWLQAHGAEAADPHTPHSGHHGGHHALMPGMLTPDEMAQLASASGVEFDRLFLQYMIRHHEGALLMVEDLLAAPGAAQATEVYRFASDIVADQQAEIDRMRSLLDVPPLPSLLGD